MIDRFQGEGGRARLLATLAEHRLVAGAADLAERLANGGELLQVEVGEAFIEQGAADADVFFVLAGAVDVIINGKSVAVRRAGEHVGEMAAIEPSQARAATVRARERSVLLKVTEPAFTAIATRYPELWRRLAGVLARRLAERNTLIAEQRTQVRVFVMSSVESLPVARLLEDHFVHDKFLTVVWNHGVFRASNYTLEDLERQLDLADFAIAIARADDTVITRGDEWPTVRDNVVFELGMFIGFLGRRRAFLMEPREDKLKLPSDLTGLTTVNYRYVPGPDAASYIAPACNEIRRLILAAGPRD